MALITTTIAGVEWRTGMYPPFAINKIVYGLPYSISIIFVLLAHEFGHYIASKIHKVDATLPYIIPMIPIPGMLNFGTLGAVIKTKSVVYDNRKMFDIGVWGPLAGFIATLVVLIYGFITLPGEDYILSIHQDYFSHNYGKNVVSVTFGNNILFKILYAIFSHGESFMPPMSEIYHYPFLCVGWFGLFITSMNLVPVGQLDGGHIVYSMFGERIHKKIAIFSVFMLIILGILGLITLYFNFHFIFGWDGWLVWAGVLLFVLKIKHPPVFYWTQLDKKRKILGYIAIIIFILSFTPNGIY